MRKKTTAVLSVLVLVVLFAALRPLAQTNIARASTRALRQEAKQNAPNLGSLSHWLSRGGNINALDEEGLGAIHFTVWGKPTDVKTTRFLLDHGANVNLQTKDGDTPLMIAAENGQVEIVRLLLAKGAKTNLRDYASQGLSSKSPDRRTGQTALERTRAQLKYPGSPYAKRYPEIIRLLEKAATTR